VIRNCHKTSFFSGLENRYDFGSGFGFGFGFQKVLVWFWFWFWFSKCTGFGLVLVSVTVFSKISNFVISLISDIMKMKMTSKNQKSKEK
jgi:hypothetical protein